MKPLPPVLVATLLAGPAAAETWRCDVPYDEVNGGGRVTIEDDRMVFVSDWPHRAPETLECLRAGRTSECMSAKLAANRGGGASIFATLYSVVWEYVDGPPMRITMRQISAIFEESADGYATAQAFPAIGYTFPLTNCETD